MSVNFRRIIRSRGSNAARLVGSTQTLPSLDALLLHAKARKKVFAFVDSEGNEGTIRSGRMMRRVDAHVRNSLTVGDGIQRSLPLDAAPVEVDPFSTPDMLQAYATIHRMVDDVNKRIDEAYNAIEF